MIGEGAVLLVGGFMAVGSQLADILERHHGLVFDTLRALGSDEPAAAELTPAVPIKELVTDDYIVCLEDGKKLKVQAGRGEDAPAQSADEHVGHRGEP